MNISIVTPLFNRAASMHQSILSSLAVIAQGYASELVLVDDGSTDDTVAQIQQRYPQELTAAVIRLVVLPVNLGVSGAKNAGAEAASGDWLIFMDSDDWFVPEHVPALWQELQVSDACTAVFFRCRDQQSGLLIGQPAAATELDLKTMLDRGTPGECLPVVKRQALLAVSYPTELRGSEGLTYLAWLRQGQRIRLSDLIAREYDNSGSDRLSSAQGLKKRAHYLVRHNLRCLQYWQHASWRTVAGWCLRIGYYSYVSVCNQMTGRHRS